MVRQFFPFVLLVPFVFAGTNAQQTDLSPEMLKRIRAEVKADLVLPSESAKLLAELLQSHCKTDLKTSVNVSEEKDGMATLTVRGEVANVGVVMEFVLVLKGKMPTREETLKKQHEALTKAMDKLGIDLEQQGLLESHDK